MPRRSTALLLASLVLRAAAHSPDNDHGEAGAEALNRSTLVNPAVRWGTWEGWGVALCWWGNVFGLRDDLADLFFTAKTVSVLGVDLPGLGFNIVRYNAGGSSWRCHEGACMQESPRIPKYKQLQGFWADWGSDNPASSSWNWSADAVQRAMLHKAHARGANHLELFSNSPMWWMLHNHNPSGRGDEDNLLASHHQDHAKYMAIVAERARDHWGLEFTSVSPMNEPSAHWWQANGTQEGCHYSRPSQARVVSLMRAELDRRDLSAAVAAPEECEVHNAVRTWQEFDKATRQRVGKFNVHGYEGQKAPRELLRAEVAGKRLWNSEYGDEDGSGLEMATNIHLDLRFLHNTAWCYWQAADETDGWGLLKFDPETLELQRPEVKHWVLAQYTRHVLPGMLILDGGENSTVAAYDAQAKRLVLVTINYNVSQTVTYDLTMFRACTGPVTRWVTNTAIHGQRYARYADTSVKSGSGFSAYFERNTVQTFEVEGVELPSDILV